MPAGESSLIEHHSYWDGTMDPEPLSSGTVVFRNLSDRWVDGTRYPPKLETRFIR